MSDEPQSAESADQIPARATKRYVRIRSGQVKNPAVTPRMMVDALQRVAVTEEEVLEDLLPEEFKTIPEWLPQAERDYVTKKLSTMVLVAKTHEVDIEAVKYWATVRQWRVRRQRVEEEAATRLANKIDDEAASALVDAFSGMDQDVIVAGQMAARLSRLQLAAEVRAMTEAEKNGQRYTPVGVDKSIVQSVRLAHELRPKQSDKQNTDQLGDVLNQDTDPVGTEDADTVLDDDFNDE